MSLQSNRFHARSAAATCESSSPVVYLAIFASFFSLLHDAAAAAAAFWSSYARARSHTRHPSRPRSLVRCPTWEERRDVSSLRRSEGAIHPSPPHRTPSPPFFLLPPRRCGALSLGTRRARKKDASMRHLGDAIMPTGNEGGPF